MSTQDWINRNIRQPIDNWRYQNIDQGAKQTLREIGSDLTGKDLTRPIKDVSPEDIAKGGFVSERDVQRVDESRRESIKDRDENKDPLKGASDSFRKSYAKELKIKMLEELKEQQQKQLELQKQTERLRQEQLKLLKDKRQKSTSMLKNTKIYLQNLNKNVTNKFNQITKVDKQSKDIKYPSITSTYYKGFGAIVDKIKGKETPTIQFYKPGEQEKLVNEGLKNLTSAKNYESQQKAINELKNQGVKIITKTDPLTNEQTYEIDSETAYKKFAPTNKIANVLVGTTDIFFKGTLFSPYMSTGAAAKGKNAKAETIKAKPSTKKAEKVISKAEQLFKEGKLEGELYKLQKNIKTPSQQANVKSLLKELKNRDLIKGFAYNEQTGKFVLLDSQGNTLVPKVTSSKPQLTLEIDVSALANVPQIPKVPEVTTGSSFFDKNKMKDMTGISRFEDQTKVSYNELGVMENKFYTKSGQEIKKDEMFFQKIKENQKTKTKQKSAISVASASITGSEKKQAEEQLLKFNQKQIQQEALALSSLLRAKQQLKQRQEQLLKLNQKQIEKVQFKLPKPIVFDSSKTKEKVKSKKKSKSIFEAVGFRFGKPVSLGEGTKEEAKQKLFGFLTKSLGASGLLKKGETKLRAEETGLLNDLGFRKSKRSPFLIVEKKSKRLRRGSTGKQIQYFRKSKGKSKNLLGL